jgi:hypothetical protein
MLKLDLVGIGLRLISQVLHHRLTALHSHLLPKGVTLDSLLSIIPGFEVNDEIMGTGGGCILDSPFKGRTVTIGLMGRMVPNNTRCLTRSFAPVMAHDTTSKKSILIVLKALTFAQFRQYIEQPKIIILMSIRKFNITNKGGGLHNIGHWGVSVEVRTCSSLNSELESTCS